MLKYLKLIALLVVLTGLAGVTPLHAQWTEDGIPLGSAGGAQDTPVVSADSTGGAVIVWRDSRPTVNTDIYAQGVAADGQIRWYPNGMPVCTASNSQSSPMVIADGSGGTIVVWQDSRTGSTLDIYAQKLNSIGYIQWTTNGVAICTGQTNLSLFSIVSDGAGGAIITWQDRRNFYNDIFAQRIDSDGTVMWTTNGVPVCTADNHQQNPVITSDGSNGAIIAWEDRRNSGYDIYAQRIDYDGTALWTSDGIVICDSGDNQMNPRIVEDGSGGAVMAWSDRRNTMDFDIFAQKVNSNGELQWGSYGTAISAWMDDQEDCRIVHIGSGETIVTWQDSRSGTSIDIYAQKLNSSGACQWSANGVVVCGAAGDQENVRIAYNGSGGALVSWDDKRGGTDNIDIYSQNIDLEGNPIWTANGEEICGAADNQRTVVISEDGLNGIFVTWTDARSGTDKAYAHRVDATGNIPTATLLRNYNTETIGTNIRIEWTLSEIDRGVQFTIFRAEEPSMEFQEIPAFDLIENGMTFSFVDRRCKPSITYYYRVCYSNEAESKLLFESGPVTIPLIPVMLRQNLPNPFNPNTSIGYYLPGNYQVRLEVYDVRGCMVKILVDESKASGNHSVIWDGRDNNGDNVSSGIYFYRLTAGKNILTKRMVLLR